MLWTYDNNNQIYSNYISKLDNNPPLLTSRQSSNFFIDYIYNCNIIKCIPHPSILKIYKCSNIYNENYYNNNEFNIECISNINELQESTSKIGVNVLYLCNISLDAATLHCISLALKGNTEIKTLQIDHCTISEINFNNFIKSLLKSSINTVKFNNFNIEDQNVFFELFSPESKLTSIKLNRLQLTDKIGAEIFNILKNSKILAHLSLDDNLLSSETIASLSACIRKNRTLASISLANNQITDDGLLSLWTHFKPYALDAEETKNKKDYGVTSVVGKQTMCNGNNTLKVINLNRNLLTSASLHECASTCLSSEIIHVSMVVDILESEINELREKYPDILENKLQIKYMFTKDTKEYLNNLETPLDLYMLEKSNQLIN